MFTDLKISSTENIKSIRKLFPVFEQEVHGFPLIYFDNAATTQKPTRVIRALVDYYSKDNANIHRGIHTLAERATVAYEDTREAIKEFINAGEKEEIIFTSGTTESINLVASAYGRAFLKPGDEIIISTLEHHSNIVPWQIIGERTGALLKIIPVNDQGELVLEEYEKLLSAKTKIVAVNHASNALGTINPIRQIIDLAHRQGAVVLIDGAQAAAHLPIDVQDLDADFYALSGHKMYGPTGIGVLYGKRSLLEKMDPYKGGGEMISEVTFEKTTYNDIPYKFEAGTPNIADTIALKEAIGFINDLGKNNIAGWEEELLQHAVSKLGTIKGFVPHGTAATKVSVLSFNIEGIHPFDIGQMLDARGIAVRTGHHCTQPLMSRFGIEGTVRASFSVYNTKEEIDFFAENLERIVNFLK
ncbi:MAG: cysteine desulfurase [Cyclobacteriaceae bacterium]|nr:cysteine desulfurase [Cyclobacteriaceae bacterium]